MAVRPADHTLVNADADELRRITHRLKRAQGQLGGVLAMIEDGRPCQDVVTQLAAISKAVDRTAFAVIAAGLKECLAEPRDAEEADLVTEQLQKLFLTLA